MSDLDRVAARSSTAVHSTAAASVSTQAIEKLKAIGGNGLLFGGTDGLIDAFAEVFASIAASRSVESEAPVGEPQAELSSDGEPVQSVEGEAGDRGDDSDQSAASNVEAEPASVDESGGIVTEVLPDDIERLDVQEQAPIEVDPKTESESHPTIERVEIAAVEVETNEAHVEEIEAPVLVVQPTSLEDGTERRRRDHQEQPILRPVSGAETGKQRRDPSTPEDGVAHAIESDNLADNNVALEGSTTEEGDRLNPVRDRRGRDRGVDPFGPAQQTSSHPQRRSESAQPLIRTDAPADLASPPPASSAAAAAPPSNDGSSVQGQNLAAVLQRSVASNHLVARSTGHNRGALQAVDALVSPKENLKPKAEAQPADKNARSETVSRVKLIQRVSKAFQHFGPDGGVVRLRLAPAELGSVRLEMRIQQRSVEARVVAETEAAGAVLREHLPDLRQRLEAQGLQIERIEIETEGQGDFAGQPRDRGGQAWGEGSRDQQSWREGSQNRSTQPTEVSRAPAIRDTASQLSQAAVRRGGIDLRL